MKYTFTASYVHCITVILFLIFPVYVCVKLKGCRISKEPAIQIKYEVWGTDCGAAGGHSFRNVTPCRLPSSYWGLEGS